MLDNKSYGLIFNESIESIPKRLKGDFNGIHEIKISRDKIYIPKNTKEQTLNVFELNNHEEGEDKTGNNNDENLIQENNKETYKYCIINDPNNLVSFPDNRDYYTNDQDLKKLIDLFNEPNTKQYGYSNVIDEINCKVYKRMVEGFPVILIKCLANMPYSKDVVFEAIANLEIRKQWDSVFSELKVVNHEGENGAEILFMIVKSPVFFISNREFVQQRKMWKNFPSNKSHILHFISVENHECPLSKKNVRAETIISGYYMQDDKDNPGHSILGVLSQTDLKGNIPHVLVNKFAPKSSKNWVKSLHKGCQIVLNNQ
jgi:hypothetical protein